MCIYKDEDTRIVSRLHSREYRGTHKKKNALGPWLASGSRWDFRFPSDIGARPSMSVSTGAATFRLER